MSRTRQTRHDKQIEIWSNALYRAMEYVQAKAIGGDKEAKQASDDVIVILEEGNEEVKNGQS